MFDLVVAAIDGSPASFRAAALGSQIAAAVGGSIELLAVVPPRTDLRSRLRLAGTSPELERERRMADIRSAQTVIDRSIPVRDAVVVEGPVVESILSRCTKGPRLICVGSGKHRVRLGSTSAGVLRQADCPVLVVREGSSRGPRMERILVAYDGSPGSDSTIAAAAELASRTGSEVHLVWVLLPSFPLPPHGLPLSSAEVRKMAGALETSELEAAAATLRAAGAEVAAAVFELGVADERLLAYADGCDVDLLVVGARGRSPGLRRVLGGVSDRVAARSTRPVLVLK